MLYMMKLIFTILKTESSRFMMTNCVQNFIQRNLIIVLTKNKLIVNFIKSNKKTFNIYWKRH